MAQSSKRYSTRFAKNPTNPRIFITSLCDSYSCSPLYCMHAQIKIYVCFLIFYSSRQLSFFVQNAPISKVLLLCNLVVHLNTLVSLTPCLERPRTTPLGPIPGFYHFPISYCLVFSSLTSIIAAFIAPLWIDRVRCLETPLVLGISFFGQRWIREGDNAITELERLQFPARGV